MPSTLDASRTRLHRVTQIATGLVLVLMLLAGGCRKTPPKTGLEEGFIPSPDGPVWVQYTKDGKGNAIYEDDVRYRLVELRYWQSLLDEPRPVRPVAYDIPNGLDAFDNVYDGAGEAQTSGAPLSGGLGYLTDRIVPETAQWNQIYYNTAPGWVNWGDATLAFHFGEPADVEKVVLHFNTAVWAPERIEIATIDSVRVVTDFQAEFDENGRVEITGLGMMDETVEIRLVQKVCTSFFPQLCRPALGEVEFWTGRQNTGGQSNEPVADATIKSSNNWGRQIPYEIGPGFSMAETGLIMAAAAEWSDKTDANLYEDSQALPRIVVRPPDSDETGCFNDGIGRPMRDGIRTIVLSDSCFNTYGTILHEFGHALGFAHEHQRYDRNEHVSYRANNVILSRRSGTNFFPKGMMYGEYNFRSIMHYDEDAFGRSMCCTVGGHSGDIDSLDGLPPGCGLFDMLPGTTDQDGDGLYDEDDDSCPVGQPFEVKLVTLKPRRALPDHPDIIVGEGNSLSKGDISALNAMVGGFDLGGRSYNSLSELQESPFTPHPTKQVGDVNGDGYDDLVSFAKGDGSNPVDGNVWVMLGGEDGRLEHAGLWRTGFCYDGQECLVGDPDGDGLDDIVSVAQSTGEVVVSLSTGTQFAWTVPAGLGIWHQTMGRTGSWFELADIDGDCRDDLVAYWMAIYPQPRIGMAIALSEPGGFGTHQNYTTNHARGGEMADVDADGRADYVSFDESGNVFVELGTGNGFQAPEQWGYGICRDQVCTLRDINGNGRADLVRRNPSAEHHLDRVVVSPSNGVGFIHWIRQYHEIDCRNEDGCRLADVNGDGVIDLIDSIDDDDDESIDLIREAGDVYVSLSTEVWMDPIGALNPVPWDAPSRNLGACLDLGFDL